MVAWKVKTRHEAKQVKMMNNYEQALANLADYPELQQAFEHCLTFDSVDVEMSFGVKGSLVSGNVDELSDIDLYINVSDHTRLAEVQDCFVKHIKAFGELLTWFRAEHINMPDLLVFYLKVNDVIVKIDAEIICLQQQAQTLPNKFLSLQDKDGIFAQQEREQTSDANFPLIHRKFCVWQWFIYCKIARGELFQAARSIDFSREHALLTLVRANNDLPVMDGHRRIEILLSPSLMAQLLTTYPTALNKRSLLDCLDALANFFQQEWDIFAQGKSLVHDKHILAHITYQIKQHSLRNT